MQETQEDDAKAQRPSSSSASDGMFPANSSTSKPPPKETTGSGKDEDVVKVRRHSSSSASDGMFPANSSRRKPPSKETTGRWKDMQETHEDDAKARRPSSFSVFNDMFAASSRSKPPSKETTGRWKDLQVLYKADAKGRRHSSSSVSVDKFPASSSKGRSASKEPGSSEKDNKIALVNAALKDIQQVRETQQNLEKSLQTFKAEYQQDHIHMMSLLEEEMSRLNVLERELTYLTELHQRETSNLKEEISSTKDIIDFRYNGRAQEFSVALDKCQSHLLKMELQHQQELDIERHEDHTARLIIEKLIKALLVVMSTILVFVCTLNQVILFFKSSRHILYAGLLAVFIFLLFKYWNTSTPVS